MRYTFILFLFLITSSCYKKINDVEINDNPFDPKFEGNLIEILEPTIEQGPNGCNVKRIHLKFLSRPLQGVRNVGRDFVNYIFEINGVSMTNLFHANGEIVEYITLNTMYDPGVQSFEEISFEEVFFLRVLDEFDLSTTGDMTLGVKLLIRDFIDADEANSVERLYQTEIIKCD